MIFLTLFIEFLKIGLFSFGGGYGSIPLFKETVLNNNWLTEEEFYNFIGVCESTPGPIMVNLATYIGTSIAGPLGGAIATFAVVLPAFLIILIVASIINKFLSNKYVKYTFKGIQPVVISLILSTGLVLLVQNSFISFQALELNNISISCFILILLITITYKIISKKKIPTVLTILIAAGIGILVGLLQ